MQIYAKQKFWVWGLQGLQTFFYNNTLHIPQTLFQKAVALLLNFRNDYFRNTTYP